MSRGREGGGGGAARVDRLAASRATLSTAGTDDQTFIWIGTVQSHGTSIGSLHDPSPQTNPSHMTEWSAHVMIFWSRVE